ncbi:MAG TPA: hypothetical protein VMR44_08535 [Thermoanaerobaculia bacterium]|nr:hypothetical protein [Thermoanaerobaculia bacterium]
MTDRDDRLRATGGSSTEELDRDVDIRAVVWTGAGLVAVTALALVLGWFIFQGLAASREARDPEPLPIPEAAAPAQPPSPGLQVTPEEDLREMLAHEKALLESYGPAEGEGGFARIPLERALELYLEGGDAP